MLKLMGLVLAGSILLAAGAEANAATEREKKQACLEQCRAKMRAVPGFYQNGANARYCKDKCGVR